VRKFSFERDNLRENPQIFFLSFFVRQFSKQTAQAKTKNLIA